MKNRLDFLMLNHAALVPFEGKKIGYYMKLFWALLIYYRFRENFAFPLTPWSARNKRFKVLE